MSWGLLFCRFTQGGQVGGSPGVVRAGRVGPGRPVGQRKEIRAIVQIVGAVECAVRALSAWRVKLVRLCGHFYLSVRSVSPVTERAITVSQKWSPKRVVAQTRETTLSCRESIFQECSFANFLECSAAFVSRLCVWRHSRCILRRHGVNVPREFHPQSNRT